MMITSLDTLLYSKPLGSLTLEYNKLKKPFTSLLMKALKPIRFSKPTVEEITIVESERYLVDEYLLDASTVQNDHPVQNDDILNDDKTEQTNHKNDENIIDQQSLTEKLKCLQKMAKELVAASIRECLFVDFLSEDEPKKVSEALKYPGWVDAIPEELNKFSKNKVWTLVPTPYGKTIIGSKWIYRKERDWGCH
ncbi:hypothetical protein Tco_0554007 [Tanacetum coccineum]